MCCIQISDEILLRNVLGSPKVHNIRNGRIRIADIEKCGIYLENNLPGYVDCEKNPHILYKSVENYGFSIDDNEEIDLSEITVSRDKCNCIYPKKLALQIERIVDTFFERNLHNPDINIVKMKHIYVN